jgi:ribosomal protein L29
MKRNDLRALREMSIKELEQRAREAKEELFNLRFALAHRTPERFFAGQAARRTYAQIQTAISEKRIVEARHGAA